MAENVEERIVAAKFDSSDFEKGVDKTVKKLDELKQSLNLKDSEKTIAELSEKTTKATESMNESITKLSERFTTFVGQVKQKLISGFADQVVNTFFRMEQAALNFAKSMTFDQISAGLQKYEDALTAVRMMTLATYKDKNGNIVKYTEDQVYAAIGALQTYADETSYSMSQMTDAMSKMVAAGVGMDQATKNVQGIASACAAAGVNATDAARAFFNLSQAYSSGGLKYTDYRSLELLNMTNEAFQNQLLEAGVRAGTLKKTGDGTYKTQKSKTNGKVTAGKTVTRKSLTESLRYNWASTEVMDELFGGSYYIDVDDFMDAKEDPETKRQRTTQERIDYLTSLYDTEKLKKTVEKLKADDPIRKAYEDLKDDDAKKTFLEQLGHDANELNKISKKYDGIDPKRFTQWINSLADDDERKKHYKALKTEKERQAYMKELEKDSGVLKAVGKKFKGIDTKAMQNYIEGLGDDNVLKQNYQALKTEQQKKKYLEQLAKQSEELGKNSKKYSEVAAAAFLAAREARNFKDVINAIGDYVSSKWSKAFENLFGGLEKAAELFTHLSEGGIAEFFTGLADKVADTAEAFNASGKGVDTFHEIIKNLDAALGNFLGIFYDVIPEADDLGISLFNLMINFREATATLEMYMVKLREWFNMAGKDEEMTRIEKIRKIMGNLSASFSIVGRVIGIATHAIAKAWNLLSPIFDAILTALVKITQPIDDLSKDKKPFDDLTHAIDNVFIALQPLMDLLDPIIKGIGDIGGAIGEFFLSGAISTVTMNIELFADALGLILEILGLDSAQAQDGLSVMQKITNSVNELVAGCKEGLNAVKEFFDNLFKDIRQLLGLKVEDDGTGDQNGGAFSRVQNFLNTNEFVQKAKGWLEQAKTDIEQFVKDLPAKAVEFVQKVTKAINDFFTKLFYTEVDDQELNLKRTGSVQGPFKKRVETPLKKWLDTAVETVSKFIAELPGNIIAGIGKAFDLFGILIDTIFGDGTKVDTKGDKDKEATKDAASAVREWGQKFIAALQTELKALPGKIGALFTKIKKKIVSAFLKIKDWFSKSEAIATIKSWGVEIVNSIKEVIEGIPAAVKSFFSGTDARKKEIQRLLLSQSLGDNERSALEKELAALNERITFGGILDSLKSIGESIFNTIIGWFSGSDDIEDNCAWFAENVIGYLKSIPSRIWKRAKEIASDIGEVWTYIIQNLTGNADENPELQKSNASFAERFPNLSKWLDSAIEWIKGIPTTLSETWNKTKDDVTKFFRDLSNYWNDLDGSQTKIRKAKEFLSRDDVDAKTKAEHQKYLDDLVAQYGDFEGNYPFLSRMVSGLRDWITNIPTVLSETWEKTKSKVVAFFSGFAKYWRNLDEINELRTLQKEALATGNSDDASGYGAMIESLENDNKEFESQFPAITNFVKNAREWIGNIYTNLKNAWKEAQGNIESFWSGFKAYWNQTLGKEQTDEEKATAEAFAQKHPEISNFISSAVAWISSIPGILINAWNDTQSSISKFFTDLSNYWDRLNVISKLKATLADKNASEADKLMAQKGLNLVEKLPTTFETENPIMASMLGGIHGFVDGLSGEFNKLIETISLDFSSFWEDVKRVFNGEELPDLKEGATLGERFRHALTNFFGNIPNDMISGIKNSVRTIKGAIESVTTTINDALSSNGDVDSALTELSEESGKKVSEATKEGLANAEEGAGESTTSSNAFLQSIIDLGQTLYDLITKTIPDFVVKGFTYLIAEWNKPETGWKAQLKTWFSGLTGIKEEDLNLDTFKANLTTWIEGIPATIMSAFGSMKESIQKFTINLSNYWDRLNVISKLKATLADKNASEADKLMAQKGLNLIEKLPTTFETENPIMASMLGGIHGIVSDLPNRFSTLVDTISEEFGKFWSDVKRVFNGEELEDLGDDATLGERFGQALATFFGNLPKNISEGINSAITTMKEAIHSVIARMKEALSGNGDVSKELDALSEESVKNATETMAENTAQTEKTMSNAVESSDNGFLQSIINLGKTLYSFITETIPEFVTTGFEWISKKWNEEGGWKAQLKTWFSGLTGIEEKDLNFDTFKNKLVEWIKGIPDSISKAFDWVREKIGNLLGSNKKVVPENIARVLSSNTLPASGQNSILDYFENLGYDISRWRKTTTLFDSISEIGKSIQEAVGGIFDGISLESITSFLGTLAGKIAANFPKFISDIVSSFMTTYNEESEKIAKETATENPFSETGSLLEKLKGWFGGLFEAISGVLDVFMEKDENGKSTGHLSTFGKVVLGIIGAIALVHIVADTINTFRHPIASADNNFQEDKKDGLFGVIKALINFLTITSVLALVASQLDEDGMKKVREVFDIIADILDRIMPLLWTSVALKYGPDALNSIGGFIDMIAGWFGKGKKTVISFDSAGMEDMAENMTKATESVKQMAASSQEAQKALHGNNNTGVLNMDGFIGNLLGALGIGAKGLAIVGVADAAGLAVNDFLSDLLGNANMFGSTINGIYDAIKGSVTDISEKIATVESAKTVITKVLELGGQIVELGAMRTSVQEGNGVIDSIATSLMLLTSQFTEKLYIDEFNTGLQNLMGMKDDIVTFTEFVTDNGSTFDDFKLAIASLGAALSFFDIGNVSNISSMDDEWVDHAAHILSRLLSNQELFSVIDMITPENIGTDSASVAKGMETLMLFATGISNLAKGLSGFTDETGDNLISLFNTLDKLSENGDSAEVGSELSKHFLSLGKGLQEFTESVSTLEVNDDKLKHAFAIIHQVSDLASRLDEVGNSWFMKVLIGGTSIQEFGVQLATLGGNMASFISAIKPIKLDGEDAVSDWNFDNVAIAMFGLERVADAAQKLTWTNIDKVKQLLKPDVDGKYLGDYIAEFFTQLVGAKVNLGKKAGNNVPIGFAGIPFDVLTNYLDSFSKFAEGLSNLGSVTSEILRTLSDVEQVKDNNGVMTNVSTLGRIGLSISNMFMRITSEMRKVDENTNQKQIDLDLVNGVFDVFKKFAESISMLYTYINNVYGSYKEGFGISAIGTPTDFLNSISSSIDTITGEADHLFAMIDKLATYTNDANVTRALRIFDIIKSIGVSLAVFSGSMFAQGTLEPLDFISNGIQELQGFGASSTLFLDALGSILTNIDTFFEDEQNVATLEKIGRMMARHIFNGINAAFNNPFEQMQPVITPVLNDEALVAMKQKVDETFGTSDMNVMFGATITESIRDAFSGINPETKEPYNYFMDLNEIKSDIKDLNKSIGELEDAMSHMKLVMDTGVVAGEVAPYVDRYIGKAGNIFWNRHVTGGVYELEQ